MSAIQNPTIQAVGYLSVEFVDADSDTTVKVGASETVNIVAPAGYLYRILTMMLSCASPGGTSSGNHSFTVESEVEDIELMYINGAHNTTISYTRQRMVGSIDEHPYGDDAQVKAPRGFLIDSSNGLDVIYYNNTDVNQANTRTIKLWVEKIKVG